MIHWKKKIYLKKKQRKIKEKLYLKQQQQIDKEIIKDESKIIDKSRNKISKKSFTIWKSKTSW